MNTESLDALRTKKSPKAAWQAPTLDDFQFGKVIIAVDQSLSACGVVKLSSLDDKLTILDVGTLKAPSFTDGRGGREHDLRRAVALRFIFSRWSVQSLGIGACDGIVHEAVPEGNFIHHPEASLLSAMAIRIVAEDHHLPVLEPIHRYTHYQFICGEPKASKKTHGKALMDVAEYLDIGDRNLIKNEGLRDALSIGLTALRKNDGK